MIQRVTEASVAVNETVIGRIGPGLLVLLGVGAADDEPDSVKLAAKVANLRVFSDEAGKMNLSLIDTGGMALVISQFTLFGETRKGSRPSYSEAARPEIAKPLYEKFAAEMRHLGIRTETGEFQAHMKVHLVNDGPVTLICDTQAKAG